MDQQKVPSQDPLDAVWRIGIIDSEDLLQDGFRMDDIMGRTASPHFGS